MAECIKCCMQHVRIDTLNISYTIWEAVVPPKPSSFGFIFVKSVDELKGAVKPGLQLHHQRMNWASRMPKTTWEVSSTHQAAKSHFVWVVMPTITEFSHDCLGHIVLWWELVLVKISYWDAFVRKHHRQPASKNFTNLSKPNYPSFTAEETEA